MVVVILLREKREGVAQRARLPLILREGCKVALGLWPVPVQWEQASWQITWRGGGCERFHEGSRGVNDPARACVAGVRDPHRIGGNRWLRFIENTVDAVHVPVLCGIACVAHVVRLGRQRPVLWLAP